MNINKEMKEEGKIIVSQSTIPACSIVNLRQLKEETGTIALKEARKIQNCSNPKTLGFFLGFLQALALESFEKNNLLQTLLECISRNAKEEFSHFSGVSPWITNPIKQYLKEASYEPDRAKMFQKLVAGLENDTVLAESMIGMYRTLCKTAVSGFAEEGQYAADVFLSRGSKCSTKEYIPQSKSRKRTRIAVLEHPVNGVFLLETPAVELYKEYYNYSSSYLNKQNIRCSKDMLLNLASQKLDEEPLVDLINKDTPLDADYMLTECNNTENLCMYYRNALAKGADDKVVSVKLGDVAQLLMIGIIKSKNTKEVINDAPKQIMRVNDNFMNSRKEKVVLSCGDEVSKPDIKRTVFNKRTIRPDGPLLVECPICKNYLTDKDLLGLARKESNEIFAPFNNRVDSCLLCEKLLKGAKEVLGHPQHLFCHKCWVTALTCSLYISDIGTDFKLLPIKCPVKNCKVSLFNAYGFKKVDYSEGVRVFQAAIKRSGLGRGKLDKFQDWKRSLALDSPATATCSHHQGTCNEMDMIQCSKGVGHYICTECLKEMLKQAGVYLKGIHEIVCEVGDCKGEYNEREIRKLCDEIDEGLHRKLCIASIKKQAKGFAVDTCINCKALLTIPKNLTKKSIQCTACSTLMCRLCRGKMHKGRCAYRKEVLYAEKLNEAPAPCPYCLQPILKNEGCDHIDCLCGKSFCYLCSAKREPTMKHNTSYHRKSCAIYTFEEEHTIEYNPKCPECEKLGKVCSPPGDLVEFDIPYDEYPEDLKD